MIVESASKKSKLTAARPSPRLSSETVSRRAVSNGTTPALVSVSTSDSVVTKSNNASINRLSEHEADETDNQTTELMKTCSLEVESKMSADVLPQNSAVVAPALSHSAKVLFNMSVA